MNPKHLLILILLLVLLITPAAAISINAPAQITSGQTITIWGFANSPEVSLTITGPGIQPLGAAINSSTIYSDIPTRTTVTTFLGYWSYTAPLSHLENTQYTITAYETNPVTINSTAIPADTYTQTLAEIKNAYTQLYANSPSVSHTLTYLEP